jgi:hypothetical protein
MKESLKVFLACFIGGFIGTAVALQLGLFWWLGLILGGFVGYMAYEFKAVIRACQNAWQAVIRIRITRKQRQKFGNYLKIYFRAWFSLFVCGSNVAIGMGLLFGLVGLLFGFADKNMGWSIFKFSMVYTGGITLVISLVMCIPGAFDGQVEKQLLRCNPIRVYFRIVPKYIFLGVVCLIKLIIRTPKLIAKAAKTIAKFARHAFIEIHSDERLLCGIDAAIGVAIGWVAGNALVGGLSGGLFGVINYEVISKRILHLAPKRN